MKEIRIGKNSASQRLDKFLKRYLPGAGAGFLYKQLRKKNITLNGTKAAGREILREGDAVRIYFSDETIRKFSEASDADRGRSFGADRKNREEKSPSPEAALKGNRIVYEDDEVLILDKRAGVLSQKAKSGDTSLVEMLQAYLRGKGELTDDSIRLYAPSVVNRIDRNTSGLVLAAKTYPAARALSGMLKDRSLQKYYLALVDGIVPERQRVRAYLAKDGAANRVTVFNASAEGASPIETVYTPIARGTLCGRDCTLLLVELVTGKTHQIRAHLSFIRHPIAGDVKYGRKTANEQLARICGLRRQFLHAWAVVFPCEDELLHAREMKEQTGASEPEPGLTQGRDREALSGVLGNSYFAPLPADLTRTLQAAGIDFSLQREEALRSRLQAECHSGFAGEE